MKIRALILFLFLIVLTISNVNAQNLISYWDANGLTGEGSEANKWGFAASTGGTDWQQANQLGVRYRDVTTVSVEGGSTFTGREFLYRWEGSYIGSMMSLGTPLNQGVNTDRRGINLEEGKAYNFSGLFQWINNANAPTYEFTVSDAPIGGNVIVSKTYNTSTRELYKPFEIYFEVPSSGEYYIRVEQIAGLSGTQGGLIGLANLDLKETAVVTPSPPYLKTGTKILTEDGTWCWFQDPRAIYHKGQKEQTYSGWITHDGKIQVASYNHETGEIIETTIKEDFQVDDHNNPTFLIRNDGRIMVCYSGHFFGPMRVLISEAPEDITSFGPESTFGTSVTYANPYQIGSSIYMFYRDGSTWHPSIAISNDGGVTWGAPQTLIKRDANQKRPYVKYTQDSQEGIHITFTTGHPRQEAANKIYYVYFKDNKFYKADGTFIKDYTGTASALDIDAGEPEVVYDASQGKGWTWDIALDENEDPVILYAAFPDDYNHHYYYATWDGTQWNNRHIVNSGRWFPQTPSGQTEPEPNYSGGLSVDPNDVSTVYLSKQVDGVFEIYKYQTPDAGITWTSEAITQNTPSNMINVRPVVPRHHKSGYFDVMWMRGTYVTYQNYYTSIMYLSPNDDIKYFDFGTNNSELDTDAIQVTNNSQYNGDYGFVDVTGLLAVDESQNNKSQTDYVEGTSPYTFKVNAFNGTYTITLVQGTNTKALSGQYVKANGVTVINNGSSSIGEWKSYTFDVDVTNGTLELEISGSNENNNLWVINSLLIETKELDANGLNINEENIELYEVDEAQLHYTTFPVNVNPEDISWTSSNENIVTVDANGLVTAVSPGTATISASINQGTIQDSCLLTVNPIVTMPDAVTFDFGTTTSPLLSGAERVDETSMLNASYGWLTTNGILTRDRGSSDAYPERDFALSSIDKEFRVYLDNGIYHIKTTHGDNQYAHDNMFLQANGENVVNNFSCVSGDYIINEFDINITNRKLEIIIGDQGGSDVNWVWNTLEIVKTGSLGIEDESYAENGFKLYPNPVDNILNITSYKNQIQKIEIFNVLGKKLLEIKDSHRIDVSNFSNGLYFFRVYSDNEQVYTKCIVKK
ncbi:BNR-4 repeat-containing protein [Aestuariibaculum sediminum]|uniref:BNR-4 repeat-containing protein n=1 Tax=Aestuariibaculum sediminum TaxID=2770637 RepID=A0A8J6QGR4_9FLAO|nr:BNR-4 repeat-containing protein [Aestuariibaculum sediminum]MBD0831549.1 BNR-4 repeat-containing protein [Aestuariibaculum sediminum]